jgi:HlyD family secretion protein
MNILSKTILDIKCRILDGRNSKPDNHYPISRTRPHVFWTLISLALVCLTLLSGCGKKAAEEAEPKAKPTLVEVSTVERRPVDTVVMAQGTLVPAQGGSVRLSPVSAGRLISVRVREGDRVTAGELIAMTDNRIQAAQAESANAALRASGLQAEQSNLEAQASKEDHASAVHIARLELEIARTELKKVRAGARPQEIAQAAETVAQAEATKARAATELERVRYLYEHGVAAKRQLDDAKTALSVADSTVRSDKQQEELLKVGAREEDLRSAELRVKTAEANLRQAERGGLQVKAKEREAQAMAESARQKQADMLAAQAAAGAAELRASISGIVSHRFLNPGDMADTTTPVVEIVQSQTLNLVANLPADEGATIRKGMAVRVNAVGLPGKTSRGLVISTGQVDPQSGLMSVRISVDNPSALLKIGEFATAEVVVHTSPRAVAIPKEAVVNRDGKNFVYTVSRDNVAHQTSVQLGTEQSNWIEALSGVKPGDRVIRLGQYELSDGASVRLAQNDK